MTLNVIKCHAGSEPILARHLHLYRKQPGQLWFACPEGQEVVDFEPVVTFPINSKLAQTFGSIESMKKLFAWCLEKCRSDGFENVIIMEYDAVFLDATQVEFKPGVFQCNWSVNTNPQYAASGYSHPPLHMDAAILQRVCDALTFLPDDAEHGYWDRCLGLALERAGIPHEAWAKGATRNTIEDSQIEEFAAGVRAGRINAVHGLKSQESYDAVMAAFAERQSHILIL